MKETLLTRVISPYHFMADFLRTFEAFPLVEREKDWKTRAKSIFL